MYSSETIKPKYTKNYSGKTAKERISSRRGNKNNKKKGNVASNSNNKQPANIICIVNSLYIPLMLRSWSILGVPYVPYGTQDIIIYTHDRLLRASVCVCVCVFVGVRNSFYRLMKTGNRRQL